MTSPLRDIAYQPAYRGGYGRIDCCSKETTRREEVRGLGISDLQLRFIFGGNLDRDQIRELFDEIERLREELGLANGEAEDYKDEMNRLAQRVERLEKALNLYGDKVNWVETYDGDSYFISMDAKDMWDYDNRPWDIALEALEPSNV